MKYFVIESTKIGEQFANAITIKDSLNEALMAFHQIRASALANLSVEYNLTEVLGETGAPVVMEHHGTTENEEVN